jgi:SAM-dependent methyltransferase
MHQSSIENMQNIFELFVKNFPWSKGKIIDVIDIGGRNVNGSYSDIFSGSEFNYQAADISYDDSVDIVLEDPYRLPFEKESVDLIISGQTFEHVEFFWVLFNEMVRVIRKKGLIILIVPSGGPIHRYPVDCYRFYPDAFRALSKYANCEVLHIYRDPRGPWEDLVGVFSKKIIPLIQKNNLRKWEKNRYELDTCPVPIIEKHSDSAYEEKKGHVPYHDVLKKIHEVLKPKFYVEIGVRKGKSFGLAKCESIGIDPEPDIKGKLSDNQYIYEMTSDSFFLHEGKRVLENKKLDLVFIDGLHLFEFALRDFMNVEKYANSNTVVVIDDIFPNNSIQAQRERSTAVWTGDVWKLAACLVDERKDLQLFFIDSYPTGMLVIKSLNPKNNKLINQYNPIIRRYKGIELSGRYKEVILNRKGALNPNDPNLWRKLLSTHN